MPDAIWIDRDAELPSLAQKLESQTWIGVDTEFLRERTFFPKLCLLQLAAGGQIWCVDTLRISSLDPLMPALTAAAARKVIHAARQDLEAVYLSTKRVITPVFDTQIAAACIGLKPQVGYAELVKTLLDVTVPKGQTRTDWSKRPLTREQLEYASDDVLYLGDVAERLSLRLRELGREHWVLEDCLALEDKQPKRGRGSAASRSSRRARAPGPKPLPSGAKNWRASAICRAPGYSPTPRFSPWLREPHRR
jgi:ribonuclease D